MIVAGEMEAGDTLPSEAQLVNTLGVSRDTLREALRMLESESLIVIRRGRNGGAVVRRPDLRAVGRYVALLLAVREATLRDIHEARVTLELPAIRLLGAVPSARLERGLSGLRDRALTREMDPYSAAVAVKEFDQALVELAGNNTLAVLSGVLRDASSAALHSCFRDAAGKWPTLRRELTSRHGKVLESLREDRLPELPDAWSEYLEAIRALLPGGGDPAITVHVADYWRAELGRADGHAIRHMAAEIAVEVRARIAEGELRDGDKLAPLPELAAHFGVSRPTLREALRILERESLIDLRTGTQGGGRILTPSTQSAARLAGIYLESQQTTLGDFWQACARIEPAFMALMASRIDGAGLEDLEMRSALVRAATDDTGLFLKHWDEAKLAALSSTGNPALTVAAELAHWVYAGSRREFTARAITLTPGSPTVQRTNRRGWRYYQELVDAASSGNPEHAQEVWSRYLQFAEPFFQAQGGRLLVDIIG